MREFFRGAGAYGRAQWLTGNLPEQFHSPAPFQLLLIFSVDTYYSPVYYSRDWKTSEGAGTTSEGTGMVTGVFSSPISVLGIKWQLWLQGKMNILHMKCIFKEQPYNTVRQRVTSESFHFCKELTFYSVRKP